MTAVARLLHPHTLRGKFLAINIPLALIATLVLFALFELNTHRVALQNLRQNLDELAATQSAALSNPLWNLDDAQIRLTLAAIVINRDVLGVRIYDESGNVFDEAGVTESPEEESTIVEKDIVFLDGDEEKVVGRLAIATTDKWVDAATRTRFLLSGAIALLVVISVVLSALVAHRRTIGIPLERLLASIKRAQQGNIRQRVVWESEDEMGAVVSAFNEMQVRQEAYEANLRNARDTLEQRVEERTAELADTNTGLTETLEQQTATSEVLGVISSSPTDVQPVFDMIAESAVRLCDGQFCAVFRFDGELIHFVAHYGLTPEAVEAYRQAWPGPPNRTSAIGRAILSRGITDIPDVEADSEFNHRRVARAVKFRSVIAVPMLHTGRPVGGIAVSRSVAAPFPDKQIELLKTFADQAVIAVENVRLFQELRTRTQQLTRSVEELKALGEVSQAVSSTLDLQTVLTTIVTQAVELCGSDAGIIYEFDEATQTFHVRATHRIAPEYLEVLRATPIRLGEGAVGQAGATRAPVQVEDIRDERQNVAPQVRHIMVRQGYRSLLAIPLLRETRLLGGLVVWQRELGNFPEKVISVLQTFAAQSVLAINNARLFQEIQDKSQQLEITSQHKSQFLANMSHELRTPMNAILGYTELIADNIYGEVPEKIRETIERIHNSGRHLLHLINDVLDLSKIEAGQLELSLDEYSMKDLVDSVIASAESLGAAKGLTLRTSIPVDLPIGKGDEQRITQVLLNLLGNAIKFTDQGEISVQVSEADSAFVVSVSDTGVGIAEDQQRNIFEEFHQVDDSITRKKGGTGLGLSITKRIIEMHGGQLRVESKPGEGSTFSFTLPVRVEQQTVAA